VQRARGGCRSVRQPLSLRSSWPRAARPCCQLPTWSAARPCALKEAGREGDRGGNAVSSRSSAAPAAGKTAPAPGTVYAAIRFNGVAGAGSSRCRRDWRCPCSPVRRSQARPSRVRSRAGWR